MQCVGAKAAHIETEDGKADHQADNKDDDRAHESGEVLELPIAALAQILNAEIAVVV